MDEKLHFNRLIIRHGFAPLNLNQTHNISKVPFIAKALTLQMIHAGKDYLIDQLSLQIQAFCNNVSNIQSQLLYFCSNYKTKKKRG